ncbi:MAG TPA: hypothetical protein VFZ21_19630 [Gemmatimonadaceae bacterium]|nr:hypothetical protein [Gemmatimonadaceae bacterium]
MGAPQCPTSLTSAAAFVGIAIALWGGPGWESADDWAALLASAVIFFNGVNMLRRALRDLMDRMPDPEVVEPPRALGAVRAGAYGSVHFGRAP